MKPITLKQIHRAVGAKPVSLIEEGRVVQAVCTNSKQMERGALFVALRGERFDGHQFLKQAADAGAVAALVDSVPVDPPAGLHLMYVADTRKAMGQLANLVRRQMRGKVIAVAGSNGKTSTKHLIQACLSGRLRGSISPKSFNNDIGVPLTIFPADASQDYLVLEMGTNHPGEIRALTKMALPDIGVITNCSAEHLEGLGDLQGVRKENASLIEGMHERGLLIINGDDPELVGAVAAYSGKKITFGFSAGNDLFATNIECDETGTRFSINGRTTRAFVPMLGRHTACNALAAIAVAKELGLAEEEILENLRRAVGPEMRLQFQEIGGIRILNDAYNANPASMMAALETLAALATSGRRIAILGDMREMGEATQRCHEEIGKFIVALSGLDLLICVGEHAGVIARTAVMDGFDGGRVHCCADAATAEAAAVELVQRGDLVLLKGSRAVHLETIQQAIARVHGGLLKAAS